MERRRSATWPTPTPRSPTSETVCHFAIFPIARRSPAASTTTTSIVVRQGDELFAVGAHCTHYHGPLADGLVVGDTVRCPWHHACFSLANRRGAARAGARSDPCWRVERVGDTVFVREKLGEPAQPASHRLCRRAVRRHRRRRRRGTGGRRHAAPRGLRRPADDDQRGRLAADAIGRTCRRTFWPARRRRTGFRCGRRSSTPSSASIWCSARACRRSTSAERRVQPRERARPTGIDALLIATGADPVRLDIPGATERRRCTTCGRSPTAGRSSPAGCPHAKRVVVVGASFIGLEVAASLRARGCRRARRRARPSAARAGHGAGGRPIHPQAARGAWRRRFISGATVQRVDGRTVTLSDGTTVDADFIVAGVGVRPAIALAEQAGLAIDRGIVVNEYLETSAPGVFAAGDVARWPDPHTGERIRVEHWVVAERQGQTAARNMLGRRERFDAVPFFWSQHYDVSHQLRRPRREVGCGRRRRQPRRAGLHGDLPARWPRAGGRHHRSRHSEPGGGGADGGRSAPLNSVSQAPAPDDRTVEIPKWHRGCKLDRDVGGH